MWLVLGDAIWWRVSTSCYCFGRKAAKMFELCFDSFAVEANRQEELAL
jgi:hypothetical protein